MRFSIYFLAFLYFLQISCQPADTDKTDRPVNMLAGETSPYLLQHLHNPVNWHPWGEEALQKAERENKMLLISIGYAACHWCHVMEHESFEDSTVAAIMNEHFVNIKVDREERPDIDDIYMTACQLSTGRGCGWPLNAFALSDGSPVYAVTYLPKEEWLRLLNEFVRLQNEEPDELHKYADQLQKGIAMSETLDMPDMERAFTRGQADSMAADFRPLLDFEKGGRSGAPKFPMPGNLEFLLRYSQLGESRELEEFVYLSLNEMAAGGLYDRLGGGFARYATDEDWKVPHFEKMLYDNAQLMSIYARAYKLNGDTAYAEVIAQTADWLEREMLDENGGFYSSLDADSEGEEGRFYVWEWEELESLLSQNELDVLAAKYGLSQDGNWEDGKNILHSESDDLQLASRFEISPREIDRIAQSAHDKLFKAREERARPGLDYKIITSWNALMSQGLLDAYEATGRERYRDLALDNLNFLRNKLLARDGRLNRTYSKGESRINAFLGDYATFVALLLHTYELTFDEKHLQLAQKLCDYSLEHFSDTASPLLYYSSDLDPPLVARKKETADNVISSSNAMMARNLHRLGLLYDREDYKQRASDMLQIMLTQALDSGQPQFYSQWGLFLLEQVWPFYEVAILGEKSVEKCLEMKRHYVPNALFLGGETEGSLALLKDKLRAGQTTIYVCQNKVCKLPVTEVQRAMGLMGN